MKEGRRKNGGRERKDKRERLENRTFFQRRNLKGGVISRLLTVDFVLIFLFSLYFIFLFFSIFRTTWVRVYQSRCHISHKLMARLQD